MMLIVPKNESKIMDEVRSEIITTMYRIAAENGIDYRFIADSKMIDEGVNQIENAMARICTKVKKDKSIVEIEELGKEFDKKIKEEENGK